MRRTKQPIPSRTVIEKLISIAVDTQCPYCPNLLTLEEMSIDHRLCKERHPDPPNMNAVENLHLVHKQCNRMKGNFNHDEFIILMHTFSARPEADFILRKRLRMATSVYGRY